MITVHYQHLGSVLLASFVVDDFGDLFQVVGPDSTDIHPETERRNVPFEASCNPWIFSTLEEH